jgi:hypothetical protein
MKKHLLLATVTFISLISLSTIIPTKSWGNSSSTHFINQVNHKNYIIAHREEDTLEVPEGKAVPSVILVVHPDARKGWNLELKVSNFKFAPEHVNQEANYTEGHAHLYINDKKVTRLYGNWYYLQSLEPGQNKITVTLNANNHHTLIFKGNIIEDSQYIEVKP